MSGITTTTPALEPNDIALTAIREAVDTLPDYAEELSNDQICDVAWTKKRLSVALSKLEEVT